MDPMVKDLLKELLPLAGPLVAVVNILIARAKTNQEEKQKLAKVSQAVSNALEKTDAYLEYLRSGGTRRGKYEPELAELWRTAGFELSQIAETKEEREMASRLRLKARAWEYIEQWPEERVKQEGIDFDTVRDRLSELERLTL